MININRTNAGGGFFVSGQSHFKHAGLTGISSLDIHSAKLNHSASRLFLRGLARLWWKAGMHGPNIFAVLLPCDVLGNTRTAFGLKQNENCFVKAGVINEGTLLDSRESTPAPSLPSEEDDDAVADRIILRFDHPPKNCQKDSSLAPTRACPMSFWDTEGPPGSVVDISTSPWTKVSAYGSTIHTRHTALPLATITSTAMK